MSAEYVHGYGPREGLRLHDQAAALLELLHSDTVYPEGHSVLEAGCGIGAQTEILARQSPGATIVAIDIEPSAVAATSAVVRSEGLRNVSVAQADLFDLPFAQESFDHVFACFVLEHVAQPDLALQKLRAVLKIGGTITAIEGDHGSAYFYPDSVPARKAISALVELQARANGNALIGRSLYPLLRAAGFHDVTVSPRTVYVDGKRPDLAEGFTRNTFTAMVEGVRDAALAARLIDASEFDRGVTDLRRAAEPDGVFCYTFFKAVATKR
ncbi:MAG TPA: methyltransferase domain-containing protein [Candidatus Binatus sp.]|nr:methyltransferase domain-containing protein [Candidatus Binatus sp.]